MPQYPPFKTIAIAREVESPENPGGLEKRVALIPSDIQKLLSQGSRVFVEKGAGLGVDIADQDYKAVGAILEEGKQASNNANALEDLPLFAASLAQAAEPAGSDKSPLDTAVDDINPDELTPRAALDLIYQLKRIRLDGGG